MSDTCPPPKSVLHRGKRYRIDDGDKIEDDKESRWDSSMHASFFG